MKGVVLASLGGLLWRVSTSCLLGAFTFALGWALAGALQARYPAFRQWPKWALAIGLATGLGLGLPVFLGIVLRLTL
jgi:hypothetical protein